MGAIFFRGASAILAMGFSAVSFADPFISKMELSELAASSARIAYESTRKSEEKLPNLSRNDVAESVRQGIYMAFKNELAKSNGDRLLATVAELKRGWRDRAVSDYLVDPNLDTATYERSIYLECISQHR